MLCWKREKGRAVYVRSGCGESWVGGVVMEEGEEEGKEEEEEESRSWSERSQPPSQKYHLVTQAPPLTSWQLLPAWLQHSSAHPITFTFISAKMHGILPSSVTSTAPLRLISTSSPTTLDFHIICALVGPRQQTHWMLFIQGIKRWRFFKKGF